MRYKRVPSFGESERALVSELVELGLDISAARILVYLISTGKAATSLEIEHGTGVSQSQVSKGLAVLDKVYGWLDSVEIRTDTNDRAGRKPKSYYLRYPPEEVVNDFFSRLEARKTVILNLVKSVSNVCVERGGES